MYVFFTWINREYGEKLKNKVIQSEGFNLKQTRRYTVSVLINHHPDLKKMILHVIGSTIDVSWNTKAKEEIIYTEKGGHTVKSINRRSYFLKHITLLSKA